MPALKSRNDRIAQQQMKLKASEIWNTKDKGFNERLLGVLNKGNVTGKWKKKYARNDMRKCLNHFVATNDPLMFNEK